jgi:site-specific recombinase XerD
MAFADVDLNFLHAYKDYCSGPLKNADSTMYKSLELIRRVLNAAIKEDIIEKSPFRNFEIKNISGNTENLTIDEVKKLHALYDTIELPKAPQNVLRYFLFGCYTGLRYSDVYNLKFRNLIDKTGSLWLDFVQQKSGT